MYRRLLASLSLTLALLAVFAGLALAQAGTKQVGVVIAFPDNKVHAELVTVPITATAFDVLQKASVKLASTNGDFGPAVCSINDTGCPSTDCFCDKNHFWAYYHLDTTTGKWVASTEGVGASTPADGAVEGFVWSGVDASFNPTDQPPLMTLAPDQGAAGRRPDRRLQRCRDDHRRAAGGPAHDRRFRFRGAFCPGRCAVAGAWLPCLARPGDQGLDGHLHPPRAVEPAVAALADGQRAPCTPRRPWGRALVGPGRSGPGWSCVLPMARSRPPASHSPSRRSAASNCSSDRGSRRSSIPAVRSAARSAASTTRAAATRPRTVSVTVRAASASTGPTICARAAPGSTLRPAPAP